MTIGHATSVWWGKQVVGTQEVQSFQNVGFSQWTPDSWERIGPGPIRSRCSLPFIATSNASTCSAVSNEPCRSERKEQRLSNSEPCGTTGDTWLGWIYVCSSLKG